LILRGDEPLTGQDGRRNLARWRLTSSPCSPRISGAETSKKIIENPRLAASASVSREGGGINQAEMSPANTTVLDNALIKVRGLTFLRGERAIFDNVNLEIPRGKITAIMGPSGCGKTTLLRIIGGQLRPNSGFVVVDGQEITAMSRAELMEMRTRMGMLFQSGALLTDLSVFENVAFPLREHTSLPEPMLRDLVLMKLEAVGLRGAQRLMPSELSGGMARRVALARAIALDPMMMMYDEPFTGQDPISMGVLVRLIKLMNDTLGLTSIVVSHDIHETLAIADYVYILSQGQIVGRGSPAELQHADNPWVRQFVNALPDGPVSFHFPGPSFADELAGREQAG
jgi:phospholipid/cholesterol/gamma-HCH transport system ATP-binding protein